MKGKNQDKIEWLKRYRQATIKLKILEEDYKEYITTFAMCKSPIITDMPTGSHDDAGLEKYFPKMEEYREEIYGQIAECDRIRREIKETIDDITGRNAVTYQNLLFFRYILGRRWDVIAKKDLMMEEPYVRGKLHGKALDAISIPNL